jgi:hypothetical protein
VGVGCFGAANVYNDGAVDWVTVEREINTFLAEKEVFEGYVLIYGIFVFVSLSVSDDHWWKSGARNDCGRDCCPVGECWSYCESCIDAGDQRSGHIFKSLC